MRKIMFLMMLSTACIGQKVSLSLSFYPNFIPEYSKVNVPYGSMEIGYKISETKFTQRVGLGIRSILWGNEAYINYRISYLLLEQNSIVLQHENEFRIAYPLFFNKSTVSLGIGSAILITHPKLERFSFLFGVNYTTAPGLQDGYRRWNLAEGVAGIRILLGKVKREDG